MNFMSILQIITFLIFLVVSFVDVFQLIKKCNLLDNYGYEKYHEYDEKHPSLLPIILLLYLFIVIFGLGI